MDEAFWQKHLGRLTIPVLKSLLDQNDSTYDKNDKKTKLLSLVISVILSKKLLNCNDATIKEIKLPEELKRKFIIFSNPSSPKNDSIIETENNVEVQKEEMDPLAFLEVIRKENEPKKSIKEEFLSQLFDKDEEIEPIIIDVDHSESELESADFPSLEELPKQETPEIESKPTEETQILTVETIELSNLQRVGFVKSIIRGTTVIIQSEGETEPLKERTKFYSQKGLLIGEINLVFGPRDSPLYKMDHPTLKLSENEGIFFNTQDYQKFEEEELYKSSSESEHEVDSEISEEELSEYEVELEGGEEEEGEMESDSVLEKKRKMDFEDERENKIMKQNDLEEINEENLLAELFETPEIDENEFEEKE
jgi:rRNA processing protein Gar1